MIDLIRLVLVKLDGEKVVPKQIFYLPSQVSANVGDRVVCDTPMGEKVGEIITTCLVTRGSDEADFINELNGRAEVYAVLANVSNTTDKTPLIIAKGGTECS